jgi:hypothetical protein
MMLERSVMHQLMEPDGTLHPILEESPSMENGDNSSGTQNHNRSGGSGLNLRTKLNNIPMMDSSLNDRVVEDSPPLRMPFGTTLGAAGQESYRQQVTPMILP